nr:LamG-like jellyroll fold domain-containing protein [uncultured Methanoregula sp.]
MAARAVQFEAARAWARTNPPVPVLDDGADNPRDHGTNALAGPSPDGADPGLRTTFVPRNKVEITVDEGGAHGRGAGHRLDLDGNLNLEDSVVLTLPGGELFQAHVVAIAWADDAGHTTWSGRLKDCQGSKLGDADDQVIYLDAFEGHKANVRLTYRATFYEQDIILKEAPQLPPGIDSESARIEVWTELFQAPAPKITYKKSTRQVKGQTVEREDAAFLQFGQMRIAEGRAFLLPVAEAPGPTNRLDRLPIQKRWVEEQGRRFLVESIDLAVVRASLEKLPPQTAAVERRGSLPSPASRRLAATPFKKPAEHELAALGGVGSGRPGPTPGLLLDFLLVNNAIINVDFGGVAADTGPAVVGNGSGDFWNLYHYPGNNDCTLTGLKYTDSTVSGVSLRVQNILYDYYGASGNTTGDPMYDSWCSCYGAITLTISNLSTGLYDFYVYSHSPSDDGYYAIQMNGQTKYTGNGPYWNGNQLTNHAFIENAHYVAFRAVQVNVGSPVVMYVRGSSLGGYAAINGLQFLATPNQAPQVNAGFDRTTRIPYTDFLSATVTDDGLPLGSTLSYTWSQLSGPVPVAINNIHALSPSATFTTPGTYLLRLTASDGQLSGSDDVVFNVLPETGLLPINKLLNINFAGLGGPAKTGFAATGQTVSDYWNVFLAPWSQDIWVNNLLWSDGSASGVQLNVRGAWGGGTNYSGDAMYDRFNVAYYTGCIYLTFSNLPSGNYDALMYGHGPGDNQYSYCGVNGLPHKLTGFGPYWTTNNLAGGGFVEDGHYVAFRDVPVSNGSLTAWVGTSGNYGYLNGIQLVNKSFVPPQINTPPTLSHISDRYTTVNVNLPTIPFTVGDATTPAGNLIVTATSGDQTIVPDSHLVLGGSGATRTLSLTAAPTVPGVATITLSVQDGELLTTTNFNLTVVNSTASDPVAWWPLDDTCGTAAMDASGRQHTGTVVGGPAWVAASGPGSGLVFDGVDDLVTTPDAPDLQLTGNLTLALWLKLQAYGDPNKWTVVCSKGASDPRSEEYAFYLNNGSNRLRFQQRYNYSNYFTLDTPAAIPLNQWTHAVITVSDALVTLYLNGSPAASATRSGLQDSSSEPFKLGHCYQGTVFDHFNGTLSDVRLYNRPLSAAEIASLFDADQDGLPDAWERQYFGNLSRGPDEDYDGDGLTNLQEYLAGSNPNPDVDADGLPDSPALRVLITTPRNNAIIP